MRTLTEFVAESAEHHFSVNPFFELGMYSLVKDVEALVQALANAGVPFEIIGGVAVNAHIFLSHRSRSFVQPYPHPDIQKVGTWRGSPPS